MKLNVVKGSHVFDLNWNIIFPNCKDVEVLSENYYKITTTDGICILADNEGNMVRNITVFKRANHIIVMINEKYYFLLSDFMLSENWFDNVDLRSGNNELVEVCVGENWGFADATGKIKIPLEYEHTHSFSQSTKLPLKVKNQGKFTFCNPKTGKKICKTLFDSVDFFRYRRELGKYAAKVFIGSKVNLLNENGELLLPEFVDEIRIENFGILVENNGLYGLFDFDFSSIFKIEFSSIFYISQFNYFILNKNKKCGIATDKGDILLPLDYSKIETLDREYATCSKRTIEENESNSVKSEIVVVYKLGHGEILSSTKEAYKEALSYLSK